MNSNTYHIFFSNFSNPLKIKIITSLKNKEQTVTELSENLDVEQSKISHALSSLRRCNIVNFNPKGKSRVYTLNKNTIIPILRLIDKHSKTYCRGKCVACSKCLKKEK